MRSMTGFGTGRAEMPERKLVLEVEIQSVNRKTLDAHLSLPRDWSGLEPKCHEWLKGAFQRGRINVQLKAARTEAEAGGLAFTESALDRSLARLRAYAEKNEIPFHPDARLLLDLAKSLDSSADLPEWTEVEETARQAFDRALADITGMREAEGASLAKDLSARIENLTTLVESVGKTASRASVEHRDALLERLKQLDLELDPTDDRVLKEIALVADRCDISEELTRLKSHFAQFREFLDAEEATGRKMDFLCQEIHREFNTCGSKTNQVEVTRAVIEGKNELERIREQVQNIE